MPTLYMTKGLPAAGKSQWAKEQVRTAGAIRVNKDDLRAMLFNGHVGGKMEGLVLNARDHLIVSSLALGKNVICDDTNLNPKHETHLRQLAKAQKASFVLQSFLDVPLEECLERDKKRANWVGESVIMEMFYQYVQPMAQAPEHDILLNNCIICDIDGTVAEMGGRSPYEWDKVGTDTPRQAVIDVVKNYWEHTATKLMFLSGRDSVCREATAAWLCKAFHPHTFSFDSPYSAAKLFMRPQGDMRKDCIVKRELYEQHIKGKYNVVAVFDDRPQVIRLWKELGLGDSLFDVRAGREF